MDDRNGKIGMEDPGPQTILECLQHSGWTDDDLRAFRLLPETKTKPKITPYSKDTRIMLTFAFVSIAVLIVAALYIG